jgi:hypothetical protein
MTKGDMKLRRWIAVPTLAGILMFGTATVADAQQPAQDDSVNEDDNGNVGLFGLIGLAGLAGLAASSATTGRPATISGPPAARHE